MLRCEVCEVVVFCVFEVVLPSGKPVFVCVPCRYELSEVVEFSQEAHSPEWRDEIEQMMEDDEQILDF